MEYTRLGSTGMEVSRICLGCMSFGKAEGWVHNPWALNEEESRAIIKRALELGVNFFDTANVYAHGVSEEILGRALEEEHFSKRTAALNRRQAPKECCPSHSPLAFAKGDRCYSQNDPQGKDDRKWQLLPYVLSYPVSTAVVGISDVSHLEENVRIASAFEPLSEEEMAEIRALAQSRPG